MMAVVVATPLQASEPMTAIALRDMCQSRYDIDVGLCAGYVAAVAEIIMQENNPSRRVCLSPAIGPQTLITHVQAAWQAVPPQPEELALYNVDMILRERFRCP